jgi:hypothetical protein
VPYKVHSSIDVAIEYAKVVCSDAGLVLPRSAYSDPTARVERALAIALEQDDQAAI